MKRYAVSRRTLLAASGVLAISSWPPVSAQFSKTEPLPSWNAGLAREAIMAFVARVTSKDDAEYVRPEERIAVFDNDGTLWAEQPIYIQAQFALDRIKELAPQHPEWQQMQPFKAALDGDLAALASVGEKGILEIVAATHSGMSTVEFAQIVSNWLATARHPSFNRPYTDMVYQPMLELLDYLRDNAFKTFIVSGGGVEFMRVFAERVYGIPPEQVIGSSGVVQFQMGQDGRPVLLKEANVEFIDDGPGKPVGINRFIGRTPIFAFGNSDGDQQMLQYIGAGSGARFMGLVHHTDGGREWAYDRHSHVGKLDKALDEADTRGWTVVDMQRDWRRVFAFSLALSPGEQR